MELGGHVLGGGITKIWGMKTMADASKIKILPELVEFNIFYDFEDPVLKDEFLEMLKNEGFEEVTTTEKIKIGGFGLLESITIARKRGCHINYDEKVGFVGVSGNKFGDVKVTSEEILKILEENDLLQEVKRFEVNSRVKVQIGKKPISMLQLVAKAFGDSYLSQDKIDKIQEIFEVDLQPFCIRLCPKESENFIGDIRRKENWLDIYLFPYIPNTKFLAVWFVFRDDSREKAMEFLQNTEEKIRGIVGVIINDGS